MRLLIPIINRYAATLLQFLITFLVAKSLTLEDAGVYFVSFGIVTVSSLTAGWGAPDGAVKLLPAAEATGDHTTVASLSRVATRFSLLSLVPGFVILFFVANLVVHERSIALGIAIWWLGASTTIIVGQILISRGATSQGTAVFYGAVNWVVAIMLLAVYAVGGDLSTLSRVVDWTALGAACAGVVSLLLLRRHPAGDYVPELSWGSSTRKLLESGLPIALGRLVQSGFIWSPVWLAGAFYGPEVAGLVGLASRLAAAVGAAIASIRFAIRPQIVRAAALDEWSEISRFSSRIAFWMTFLCLLTIAGNVALGTYVIGAFFGNEFSSAAPYVTIMLFATLAESAAGAADEVVRMTERGTRILAIQAVFVTCSTSLQAVAGVLTNAYGLVACYSVGFVALYVYLVLFLQKRRGILLVPRWPRRPDL